MFAKTIYRHKKKTSVIIDSGRYLGIAPDVSLAETTSEIFTTSLVLYRILRLESYRHTRGLQI